jgi:hypothetical protein
MMMRVSILFVSLWMFCSCSADVWLLPDGAVAEGDSLAVSFIGVRTGEGWGDGAVTRMTDAGFSTGDSIGIYMLENDGGKPSTNAVRSNVKYIADTTGAEVSFRPAGGWIYYPPYADAVRFVAYHPYLNVNAGDNLNIDFTDQSTAEKMAACDYLRAYVDVSGIRSNSAQPVMLNFWRECHKIRIKLVKDRDRVELDDLNVHVLGLPATGTVNMGDFNMEGCIKSGLSDTIVCYSHLNGDTLIAECIVPACDSEDVSIYVTDVRGNNFGSRRLEPIDCAPGALTEYVVKVLDLGDKTSDGSANCYLVAPGDSVKFRLTRPYEDVDAGMLRTDEQYDGAFDAEVLWDDNGVIDSVSVDNKETGPNAVLTVRTHTDRSGNAVVKIFKKGDTSTKTPVWSYHIWVTDYTGEEENINREVKGRTHIVMDRNLGATTSDVTKPSSHGLLYQHGRKDPFPSGSSGAPGESEKNKFCLIDNILLSDTSSPKSAFIQSIRNPTSFMVADEFDWTNNRHETAYWTSEKGITSPFDPCPKGWRILSLSAEDRGAEIVIELPLVQLIMKTFVFEYVSSKTIWVSGSYTETAIIFFGQVRAGDSYKMTAYPVRCEKELN